MFFLKRSLAIGLMILLGACDAIVNKDKLVPPTEPPIPQAVVEAVRYTNPGMADATLTQMAQKQLWLAEFPTAANRHLLLLDDAGELLFDNHLVGKPQQLPVAVRDEANRLAQEGFITSAGIIMKDKQTAAGYAVEIKLKGGQLRKLRFNTGNTLESDNAGGSLSRVTSVYLTTTEQVANEVLIPVFVRTFIAQNQFAGANVAVYLYEDKTARIILTNYQLDNKSVITTEILLADTGLVLEWIAPLENEVSYQTASQTETPSEVAQLLSAQSPSWTWEYTVAEKRFGKISQWKVRGKTTQETIWATLDLYNGVSGVTKGITMNQDDLPVASKQYLGNQWPGWQWTKGQQIKQVGKNTTEKYVIEVKAGADAYIVLFDGVGNRLYQYKKAP
ncbi:MAG: hypothetical protein U0X91_19065 [Spirosomataceae bacterium]